MRFQYQQRAEPVSTSSEAVLLDKWEPRLPEQQYRRKPALIAAIVAGAFFLGDIPRGAESITPDKWLPVYPDRISRARRPFWEGASVTDAAALARPESSGLDKWSPVYPDRLTRLTRIFPVDHSTSDAWLAHVPPPPAVIELRSMAMMGVGQ